MVAPETNQSGASHSLSLHEPLRMRQIDERAFAVRGTPTDSVIMGVRHVLKDKPPDLVLSGVNRGANMAEDVTYSGTIAGAFEGTILGIRSMALSQAYGFERGKAIRWETAHRAWAGADPQAAGGGMGAVQRHEHQLPRSRARRRRGHRRHARRAGAIRACCTSTSGRTPGAIPTTGWRSSGAAPTAKEGTDLWAVYCGHISVTPLFLDLTHQAMRETLARGAGSRTAQSESGATARRLATAYRQRIRTTLLTHARIAARDPAQNSPR